MKVNGSNVQLRCSAGTTNNGNDISQRACAPSCNFHHYRTISHSEKRMNDCGYSERSLPMDFALTCSRVFPGLLRISQYSKRVMDAYLKNRTKVDAKTSEHAFPLLDKLLSIPLVYLSICRLRKSGKSFLN